MTEQQSNKWLEWTKRLQAIAQSGLTYGKDKYDIERYKQIRSLAAEIAATYSDHKFEEIARLFEREKGYATPKMDCRGFILKNDKVLLVREILDGKWTLPGGWIDVNESPQQAVEKEIREESGYEAKAIRLLALYDKNQHAHPHDVFHCYKAFFLCEITGGTPRHSLETDGVDFFAIDNLPELSLARILPEQIKHLYERVKAGVLEAEFD
ncbi:NUDIX hydrolase [candidate division KSB1 bacterium]|nr:NUDIX hydrolase [candidate division KSB1 bacterium]